MSTKMKCNQIKQVFYVASRDIAVISDTNLELEAKMDLELCTAQNN